MAATLVGEIPGRRGSHEQKNWVHKYTQLWLVSTSLATDGQDLVLLCTGLPQIGDIHPENPRAWCKSRIPEQDRDNPNRWVVQLEYSDETEPNPLNRPPEVRWDMVKYSKVVDKDLYGVALTNSVGERFDPAVEIEDSRPQLTVVRNEGGFDPALAYLYQDAINSDWFFGASPGQARVEGITGQSKEENNFVYWAVTYVFQFRREGWTVKILDQGFHEIVNGARTLIYDDRTKQPLTAPVLLNGKGKRLPPPKKPSLLAAGATVAAPGGVKVIPGPVTVLDAGASVTVADGAVRPDGDNYHAIMPTGTVVPLGGALELPAGYRIIDLLEGDVVPNPIPANEVNYQWNWVPGYYRTFNDVYKKLPFATLGLP